MDEGCSAGGKGQWIHKSMKATFLDVMNGGPVVRTIVDGVDPNICQLGMQTESLFKSLSCRGRRPRIAPEMLNTYSDWYCPSKQEVLNTKRAAVFPLLPELDDIN